MNAQKRREINLVADEHKTRRWCSRRVINAQQEFEHADHQGWRLDSYVYSIQYWICASFLLFTFSQANYHLRNRIYNPHIADQGSCLAVLLKFFNIFVILSWYLGLFSKENMSSVKEFLMMVFIM